MEPEEVQELKKDLEYKITLSIRDLVRDFTDKTGLSPESIFIETTDFTRPGDFRKKTRVTKTSVNIGF